MLEEIKQIKDLETIFNMLDNIDDFNLSEDEYAKVINYLARKYIEVEKYLTDNYPLLYLLDKKMKEKNAPLQLYFKSKIMYKIMKNNLYPYFEKLDSNFDFTNLEYKGSGSSNFTFFFADKVLKILKQISNDGKLVIVVTHSNKVKKYSSRVITIEDGLIKKDEILKNVKNVKKRNKSLKRNLNSFMCVKLGLSNIIKNLKRNILLITASSIGVIGILISLYIGSGVKKLVMNLRITQILFYLL